MRDVEDEFKRLGVQVLLVSFGTAYWARAWHQETGAPFPLLLDPERTTYQVYGLGSSFIRVWSPRVMWHYLKLILAGEHMRPVQGDPHQLGGDFIVDADGVIRFAHPSKDPLDRPPLTVTFCPLCNTAIAFERTLDGRVLDFGTRGRLRFSNLIMYDRQTESWWQQAGGNSIAGGQHQPLLVFVGGF